MCLHISQHRLAEEAHGISAEEVMVFFQVISVVMELKFGCLDEFVVTVVGLVVDLFLKTQYFVD